MRRSHSKVLFFVSKFKRIRIRDLVKLVNLSYSQVLNILKELDRLGLVVLRRGSVETPRIIGDLVVRLGEKYPLEEILSGSVPIILSKIFEPKNVREISALTGFTEKYVRRVLNKLSIKGVVEKEGDLYVLTEDPLVRVFVSQISRVLEGVEPEARVVYRDNYYVLKELPKGVRGLGVPTAFSAFREYGLDIDVDREIYLYPPKKLDLEEVIVHSLLVAKNRQENTLIALLYAKHYYKIDHTKLFFYAKWFNQIEKLFSLENYLNGSEEPIFLPWRDFVELAELYKVDLTPFKKKTFSEKLFSEIGEKLGEVIQVLLFGGALMVIRGYKTSTKDVDVAIMDKHSLETLIKILMEMGYVQRTKTGTLVFEHKKLARFDIYFGKIGKLDLSETIRRRLEIKKYGKLEVAMLSDTDLLLTKLVSGRPRDIEDAKILIRRGDINWSELLDELEIQEKSGKHHCLTVLTTLEEIEKQLKIHIPYKRRLLKMTTEHMVEVAYREYGLRNPRDIKKLINVSEETIRKILRKKKMGENNK